MCLQAYVCPGDSLSRGHLRRLGHTRRSGVSSATAATGHQSVALRDAAMTGAGPEACLGGASPAPGSRAFGDPAVGGRLSAGTAASLYGYVPHRPRAVMGPAGPGEGQVGLFYSAVERAAAASHRSQASIGSSDHALDGTARSEAAEVMRRRRNYRFDADLSAETEGILSSITAFRYGLQRMESRRRWLGAAMGSPLDVAAPPVSITGVATEPYPNATR